MKKESDILYMILLGITNSINFWFEIYENIYIEFFLLGFV